MRIYRFTREQFVALPLDEVFGFFADAGNLELLTPPWLHFEMVTRAPIAMQEGTLIDYKLRLHGAPIRWQSAITVWQPPYRFVDRQRRGPYRLWIHTHDFESLPGGTLVTDTLDYAVPGGDLVQRFLVRPDLDRIFDYRARQLDAWVLDEIKSGRDGKANTLEHATAG